MVLCALVLSTCAADGAVAQDVPHVDDPDGTIVVTAERSRADRLDVPVAVSTLTGADLARLGAPTLRNAAAYAPGLYVESESPSRTFVAIRGISTDVPDADSEPRVAIFQDGVSQSRRQGSQGELFDIARVEVVRGPQSTLYGRGALIGAVSIDSNRPDPDHTAFSGRAQYGTFDTAQFDAMINLPLADGVGLRVAGRYRNMDGYVPNPSGGTPYDGGRAAAARASLRIAPSGRGTLDLIASYEHDQVDPIAYKSGTFDPAYPTTGQVLGDRNPFTGTVLQANSNFVLGDLGARRNVYALTALGTFALTDQLSLASTTGYRGYRSVSVVDSDGTALQFITSGQDDRAAQLSQELRLTYSPGRAWRVLAGGDLFQEDVSRYTPFQIDERLVLPLLFGTLDRTNPILKPVSAYTNPAVLAALIRGAFASRGITLPAAEALAIAGNLQPNHREQYTNWSSTTAAELFGNVTFAASRLLDFEAGARFSDEQRDIRYASSASERSVLGGVLGALRLPASQAVPLLGALAAPNAPFIPQSASYPIPVFGLTSQPTGTAQSHGLHDDGWSWRFTARYAPAPTFRVYASYARGRRPDVASAAGPLTPGGPVQFTDLAAETVDSYEIGTKYRSADGRLAVETAAYTYTYSNFQTQVFQNQQVVSIDAGHARAYGAELQVRAKPVDALTLVGTYAYNRARFETGLFDGNHFRLAPDHSASATAILQVPVAIGTLEFAPSVAYRSRVYFDDTNGKTALLAGTLLAPIDYRPSQSGYAVANLHVGFAPATGRWRLEAFSSNLFNKRYLRDTGAGSLDYGLPTYVAAPPRTVGAALSIAG